MKKYVFLTLALVLAASGAVATGVHIVGGTPNSANTYPFYGGFSAFRWQTMWFQTELREAGPVIKIEWQMRSASGGQGGTYRNCDILLCITSLWAVTSTFANNYAGNTPVNVFKGTYVLPASSANQWVTIVEPKNFTYNNTGNLLIEVSWQGATAGTNFFKYRSTSTPPSPGRVWNTKSKTATTGTVSARYHQYGRITIGYVGVEATSLGRVKSLFR
ncbi:MAG: hypothetical protein GTN49_11475 [candidate division Zixibacteria bacterium]|nr:hypothetical protein [candidate division Zixibacteria bacterium]